MQDRTIFNLNFGFCPRIVVVDLLNVIIALFVTKAIYRCLITIPVPLPLAI